MEHEAFRTREKLVFPLTRTDPEFCADLAIAITIQKYPKYQDSICSDPYTELFFQTSTLQRGILE